MRTPLLTAALLMAATTVPAHATADVSRYAYVLTGTVTMPCDGCGWRSDGTFTGTAATATRVESVTGTFIYDEQAPCLGGAGHLSFTYAGVARNVHWSRTGVALTGYSDGLVGAGTFVRDSAPCGGPATGTFVFALGWSVFDPGPA